ncbi:MAG: hypothetical protein ACRD5R_10515, partial [Candidatus Acidiferrales bacterium]
MRAFTLVGLTAAAILCLIFVPSAPAQETQNPTAKLLSELIRVNTSNPPGNEETLDELLAA